jgi:hypothetical protein
MAVIRVCWSLALKAQEVKHRLSKLRQLLLEMFRSSSQSQLTSYWLLLLKVFDRTKTKTISQTSRLHRGAARLNMNGRCWREKPNRRGFSLLIKMV